MKTKNSTHSSGLAPERLTARAGGETAFMNSGRLIRHGTAVIIVFVVGFLAWASFAQLQSAILAPGVVVVESHRKTIQHLEGGIVKDMLVADGDHVKIGQSLVLLEEAQAQASVALLSDQVAVLSAQEARLSAEQEGVAQIAFPRELVSRGKEAKVAAILAAEQNNFTTRRDTLSKQIDILGQRIKENERQIAGLHNQLESVENQLQLIGQETSSVEELYMKGLSTLPRVLALRRQTAELTGQRGQITERIAEIELSGHENTLQMTNLANQQLSEVATSLRDVQARKFEILERLNAASDVRARLVLTAPVSGKIVNLAFHTNGGVIRPGETVMEIVPDEDRLEIETHVRPDDADLVQVGMPAHVNFTSYKQRRLPQITGEVTQISADRLTDERSGLAYFRAVVTVDRAALDDSPDLRLIPGMPAEIAIATGTRTFLDYVLAPISDVVRRGLREQ